LLALIGFAGLVFGSARILVTPRSALAEKDGSEFRHGAWLLTVAVVGASATQLLVPRWLELAQPLSWLFVVLSLAPVVFQAVAVAIVLAGLARNGPMLDRHVNRLFLFLGPTLFAVMVALGFIVYWSDNPLWAFRHLAIPFTVAAWPLVICGAFINDRLKLPPLGASVPVADSEQTLSPGLSPAIARLTGLVLGIIGAGILFATLALAWPRPAPLIVIGLLNAAVLAGVAGLSSPGRQLERR
jgi:hypothetical protein